jgi:hypothetical protein
MGGVSVSRPPGTPGGGAHRALARSAWIGPARRRLAVSRTLRASPRAELLQMLPGATLALSVLRRRLAELLLGARNVTVVPRPVVWTLRRGTVGARLRFAGRSGRGRHPIGVARRTSRPVMAIRLLRWTRATRRRRAGRAGRGGAVRRNGRISRRRPDTRHARLPRTATAWPWPARAGWARTADTGRGVFGPLPRAVVQAGIVRRLATAARCGTWARWRRTFRAGTRSAGRNVSGARFTRAGFVSRVDRVGFRAQVRSVCMIFLRVTVVRATVVQVRGLRGAPSRASVSTIHPVPPGHSP